MKPLVVIPARAGSKGIPGKNWKLLHGKPLIQYSIDAALACFQPSEICVSTDEPLLIEIAERIGLRVPFIRPKELATDTAGSREVLLHALTFWEENYYTPDVLILLQPTSPFRAPKHILEGLKNYNNGIDMVVGVKETKANPYYVLREEGTDGYLKPSKMGSFTRRQDCPKVYEINGAFYAINPARLKSAPISEFAKVVKYEMDERSSHDIDNPIDWIIAESLFNFEIL